MKNIQKRLNNIEKLLRKIPHSPKSWEISLAAKNLFLKIPYQEYSKEEKENISKTYKNIFNKFDLCGINCMSIYEKMYELFPEIKKENIDIISISSNIQE